MKHLWYVLVLCAAGAVAGCSGGGGGSGGEAKARPFTVAFVPKIKGIPYFTACQRGAEEAAKELGIKLVYDGPTKADSNEQITLLTDWIASGDYDCLAVACTEKDRISPTLKQARDQGLPVVTYD